MQDSELTLRNDVALLRCAPIPVGGRGWIFWNGTAFVVSAPKEGLAVCVAQFSGTPKPINSLRIVLGNAFTQPKCNPEAGLGLRIAPLGGDL